MQASSSVLTTWLLLPCSAQVGRCRSSRRPAAHAPARQLGDGQTEPTVARHGWPGHSASSWPAAMSRFGFLSLPPRGGARVRWAYYNSSGSGASSRRPTTQRHSLRPGLTDWLLACGTGIQSRHRELLVLLPIDPTNCRRDLLPWAFSCKPSPSLC